MLLLSIICVSANAQKLPNVQQVSLRAPANVKVDGKADEWGDFKAYNSDVGLSYSLANDKENLYLVVQAGLPRMLEKIIAVGITFTINKNGTNDYKAVNNTVVTFPVLDFPTRVSILVPAGIQSLRMPSDQINAAGMIHTALERDSLREVASKLLNIGSKIIKVSGFTGLPDTLSTNNSHNIKTGINLDKKGAYTYELQIPLKLLGLSPGRLFSYSIKLRSISAFKNGNEEKVYKYKMEGTYNPNLDMNGTADFWGKYTLAK